MRDEILRSWSFDPTLAISCVVMASLYLRGAIRWRRPRALRRGCTPARIACYLGGLLAIWVALASPLEAFAPLMLSAHMGQHMLLTMVAAPLLLIGEPFLPLLRGLPATVRRTWFGPFIASPLLRRIGRCAVHPLVAWTIFNVLLLAWHVPALYELALREPAWHRMEHLALLAGAILFWWPVIVPAPSRAWWPRWAMVPYLLAADLVNTLMAAIFAFAPSVIYGTYATTAPAVGVDALRDQAAAGALMWVPGSVAYLLPAAIILVKVMRPAHLRAPLITPPTLAPERASSVIAIERGRSVSLPLLHHHGHAPARAAVPPPFDLLRVPLLGALLRSRPARLGLRTVMLLLAVAIVVDGFHGPREAPMNLAGTLPWTHWRGMAVLLLLVGGNFLCMGCPFLLPRFVASRWLRPVMRWPRRLRSKWTAVFLAAIWLITYEAFDLWASPLATAWVIIAYFVGAFVVDSLASGGSFCKWVCPLGQFHFVQSTLSPLTVAARDPTVCATCTTHDCLRGNSRQRGCELELFVPRKGGNLDCTFCLDCVDACPHGNVGLLAQPIGAELRSDAWRSSLGRLGRRLDVAALLLLLSVGSVANAAGMTAPVLEVMAGLAGTLLVPRAASAALVVGAMLLLPFLLVLAAGAASALAGPARAVSAGSGATGEFRRRAREAFIAVAIALAPLGAAVWLVHFSFHFVTSWQTAAPVLVRAANDVGLVSQEPAWSDACCTAAPTWLLPVNLLALSLGAALALWTLARRIAAMDDHDSELQRGAAPAISLDRRTWRAWAPGAIVIMLLWCAAAWVVFQPMDMRGTLGFEVAP